MKFFTNIIESLIDTIISQLYGLVPVNIQMLIFSILILSITIYVLWEYRNIISIKWFIITFILLLVLDPLILFLLSNQDITVTVISKMFTFLTIGFLVIILSKTQIVTPVTASLIYTVIVFLSNANYIIETVSGGIIAIFLSAISVLLTTMLIVYLGAYFAMKIRN